MCVIQVQHPNETKFRALQKPVLVDFRYEPDSSLEAFYVSCELTTFHAHFDRNDDNLPFRQQQVGRFDWDNLASTHLQLRGNDHRHWRDHLWSAVAPMLFQLQKQNLCVIMHSIAFVFMQIISREDQLQKVESPIFICLKWIRNPDEISTISLTWTAISLIIE